MTRLTEVAVLALILSHAVWNRLLGLAILEGAKIEGPGTGGLLSVTDAWCNNTRCFMRVSYSLRSPTWSLLAWARSEAGH